ncbi:MAG: HPr family phosphocarrier protein [Phycisphaeraceae bacterium]|nr:HPr family phosphocarrier protein [Phycisphaerales bacterium]MCB9859302.1 HPr family phosphocarrier protein [Phycisphaeraceae bacterium]
MQNTVADKLQTIVTIVNRLGLHARPAMALVDVANTFPCEITLARKNQSVNAKSVMEVLLLAATQGSELTITAKGDKAQEALDALSDLVARGFDED